MVDPVLADDLADGMQCSDHPFRPNPGGICAFCLQDKLGKLVSSSLPLPLAASSSASSSPSFRSDFAAGGASVAPSSLSHSHHRRQNAAPRIPFLLAKKKKKVSAASAAAADLGSSAVFKRSKSTNHAPRRTHFVYDDGEEFYSPRKRGGFWSFLHLSHSRSSKAPAKSPAVSAAASSSRSAVAEVDADDSPSSRATAGSFDRKVSRSRSVGCGSRSFSGDFFERISTGFGDCTLRRVESQREGKPKSTAAHRGGGDHHNCTIKERVKCGGIFGGFIMTSSSSSSSSSSYWVSGADELPGKSTGAGGGSAAHGGRGRSWGWAIASPMRAFTKPSGKRDIVRQASDKSTTTPDLAAIPSLLSARG